MNMNIMATTYSFVNDDDQCKAHFRWHDDELYLYLNIGETQIQGQIQDFKRINFLLDELVKKAHQELKKARG